MFFFLFHLSYLMLLQINQQLPTDISLAPAKSTSPLYHRASTERMSLAIAPAVDKSSSGKLCLQSSPPHAVKVSGRRASTSPRNRFPLTTGSRPTQVASARTAGPKSPSSGAWWTSPAAREGSQAKERQWRVQLTAAEDRIRILEEEVRFWKARCLELGDP